MGSTDLRLFQDTPSLVTAATDHLSVILSDALDQRGRASAMLSGGSSPKPVYERLAQQPLAWNGVAIGLVDERWVPAGKPGSNADFIRGCFADSPAERAHFVPLFNGHASATDGLESAEQALALMAQPFDLCVLGMGMDGHTASWFPRSGGLEAALDPNSEAVVTAIDATGCEVAGDHTDRMTLTYAAVAASKHVVLLLPSAEKLAVFNDTMTRDVLDAPVKALQSLGDRMTLFGLDT